MNHGMKVTSENRERLFELLLETLAEERDIPGSWYLTAFKITPGRLPDWADDKLKELKADERELWERDREVHDRMHEKKSQFKYQVAISFAGEDRAQAEELAARLTARGITVFYDDYAKADLWGKDLYQYLQTIYRDTAQYCVVLISNAYARKLWTRHELKQAQARAFQENREYILPVRLDGTEIPGINDTTGYISLRNSSMEDISDLLQTKLATEPHGPDK